jgi:hypothetical protein
MYRTSITLSVISLTAALSQICTPPASARVLSFTGSATATAAPFPDASCAPLAFRGIASGAGSSNLGSFSYSQNVCTAGGGPVTGVFELDFGTSSFSGLLDGVAVLREPGFADQMFTYVLTGGTGRFAGASGSFTNIGTVDNRGGPPSRLTLNFEGAINAPAIPEPATWAMMILGFGLVGGIARNRRMQGGSLLGHRARVSG